MGRDMDPTSEAYARVERAYERYYDEMDTEAHRLDIASALTSQFEWRGSEGTWRDSRDASIETEKYVMKLSSLAIIALAIGLELDWAKTYDDWATAGSEPDV